MNDILGYAGLAISIGGLILMILGVIAIMKHVSGSNERRIRQDFGTRRQGRFSK